MKKLLPFVLLAFSLPLFAQNLPPGKWWRRPEIVQTLNLSAEQQDRLESIFRAASGDLIDAKAAVEKQTIQLRGDLDQPTLDRTTIRRDASRLSEARARLFDRELNMLVDMRAVLNDAQWNRMRNELDRLAPPRAQRPRARQR